MPVIDRRGQPLPPTHPFATPRVIFGVKPPPGWKPKQTGPEAPKTDEQQPPKDGDAITSAEGEQ